MSAMVPCPSSALLRSLKYVPFPRQLRVRGRRTLHTSPKSNEEKTFRGQLYESTARRIQAQREAEARFAAMSPTSEFSRNATLTFGMNVSAAEALAANSCSCSFRWRPRLLARKQKA